jgi:phosphohistidine phosphatase SixA
MLLYIVRHGLAGQHGDPRYPDDDLRPLTDKGTKQVSKVAKKLVRRGFAPTLVATSPLVRCRQTADAICQRIAPPPELVEWDALRPGSGLAQLVSSSNSSGAEELAWVGHAPDVDELCAALLGARPEAIAFAKGAIAAIRFQETIVAGMGELRWYVTPAVLGA